MRSPGKAIDPRVMTGDLSNDQISYSIDRFNIVNDMMKKIKSKFTKLLKADQGYHFLDDDIHWPNQIGEGGKTWQIEYE